MADPRRFQTRFSDDSDTSDDERREPGYNPVESTDRRENDMLRGHKNVPKSAETRPGDDPPVSILDSQGQELIPGDVVWTSSEGYTIYFGDMDVVWCRYSGWRVEKEKLTMTQPFKFSKVAITRGSCEIYPPWERVARAESWMGKMFTEGDEWWYEEGGVDFMTWVCTGQTWKQAYGSGFRLQR